MISPNAAVRIASQRAFTLMELMVVVVIIGILAALAVPSFNDLIKGQKIKTAASDINASLTHARSEALKRNRNVTLAPVTAGVWQSGWTIADPDNAGSNIEVHAAVTVITITGPGNIVYQSSGRIQGSTAPAFNFSAAGTSTLRCVSVDLGGRPYVKSAAC